MEQWSNASLEDYYTVEDSALKSALFTLDKSDEKADRVSFLSPLKSGLPENDRAIFDLFPCEDGWKAPTMLLLHGLMSVNDWGYRRWAKTLNRMGWNVIFPQLPFHYGRRSPGYRSGELATGPDILRTVEGVRQSVQELRILLQWLQLRGCPLVGAWGTSYGGWIAGILGCVDARLHRMILLEPVLNLQHAIWHSHGTGSMRAELRRRGVSQETVASHMRLCCPSFMQLKMEARHVILVGGEFDRITPPEEIARLHAVWPGSHFHISSQGHVGHKMMPESFKLAQALWSGDFSRSLR